MVCLIWPLTYEDDTVDVNAMMLMLHVLPLQVVSESNTYTIATGAEDAAAGRTTACT